MKRIGYAEVKPDFAQAKVVQTEGRTLKNLFFKSYAEVKPNFAQAKLQIVCNIFVLLRKILKATLSAKRKNRLENNQKN